MRISTKLALLGLIAGATRTALEARDRKGTRDTRTGMASASASAPEPAPAPPPAASPDPVETLVAQEEAAAAAEAAAIGGPADPQVDDPAMDPVYQAGGGEQEGFEAAEQQLIEAAQHGDSGADPMSDAFAGEVESDRSTAAYGDSDRLTSTETEADTL